MADPDLQIRRGVGGGWGSGLKKPFSALWASVWSKTNGGGGLPGNRPWLIKSTGKLLRPGEKTQEKLMEQRVNLRALAGMRQIH